MENNEKKSGLKDISRLNLNELNTLTLNGDGVQRSICLACLSIRYLDYYKHIQSYHHLDREERIMQMKKDLIERNTEFPNTNQSYLLFMELFIQQEEELLEKERQIAELERDAQMTDSSFIGRGFFKLILNGNAMEIVQFFGNFIFNSRNKDGQPLYTDNSNVFANWLSGVISLHDGTSISLNTVRNYLPRRKKTAPDITKALNQTKPLLILGLFDFMDIFEYIFELV